MALALDIDRGTSFAVYRQIAEQIRTQINNGTLLVGSRLPSIRGLAAQVGVTRLTIQNAYNILHDAGLIETIVGDGTYVSRTPPLQTVDPEFGQMLTHDKLLNDIMTTAHVTGARSLSTAMPDPAFFPADEFWSHMDVVRNDRKLLHYGPIGGDPELRVAAAEWLQGLGISAEPNQLLITNGAMQGIDLICRLLSNPGDKALVETPTFVGFLNLLNQQGVTPINVSLESDGPNLAELEQALKQQRPRFYYSIPSFHNPTGVCFSAEKRQAIVDLTRKYDVVLIEDAIYAQMAYDGPPPLPMKALPNSEHVIYVSSLSKMLLPGIRVGYLLAEPQLLSKLTALRHASDLCGSPLMQRVTASFLRAGGLKRHLKHVRPIYRQRRDAMVRALGRYMPHQVEFTRPKGGYCTWLTLPRVGEPGALYRTAHQQGIAIGAGEAFLTYVAPSEHVRLCFGNLAAEAIDASVAQLAEIIREQK